MKYINMKIIYITIIIILIVLTIQLYINSNDIIDNNINGIKNFTYGYWESDDIFNNIAGINSLSIIFDNDTFRLIIVNVDELEYDETFIYKINCCKKNINGVLDKINMNLILLNDDLNDSLSNKWINKKLKMILSVTNGYLEIYDNDILLCKCFKNSSITNLLNTS